MEEIIVHKTLNVLGMRCPYPLLKTVSGINTMNSGENLLVITDDQMAPDNLDSWAEKEGHRLLLVEKIGEEIKMYIKKK